MKKRKILGLLIISLFLVFGMFSVPVKATMTDLSLINTNPGEDSSSQMRLSWQSSAATCTLYYTVASDTAFQEQTVKTISGVKNTVKYSGNDNYYKYDFELTNLQANTKYAYKIKANSTTSEVYTFKTAGNKGTFNFALIGDIHANSSDSALKNAEALIKAGETLTKDSGGFDFVLSQGDLVKYGQRYEDWEQWNNNYILKNYMFSTCPGNKEYYNTGHDITSYDWFMATFNNPKNGPEVLPTIYWFIYDSILFFQTDNINPNEDNYTSQIQEWMANVIKDNEGKYQYIVLVHHYADFYSASTSDYICYWGDYTEEWYKFYDQYDFDFVISGDYHSYTRTHQLYNNQVSTDDTKGTVYVTVPMVAPSVYNTNIVSSSVPQIAMWTPNGSASHGASYFKVTKGGLTYYEYGQDGKVYDSVTVKPKHLSEVSLNAMMDTIEIVQNQDKTVNQIYFSPEYNDIVTSISVRINGTSKSFFYPSKDNQNTFTLPSLNLGDEVSLNIKFANGTNKMHKCSFSLQKDYGEIYGFHMEKENNKILFKWQTNLQNDVVKSFAIYQGEALITSLTSDKTSYEASDLSLLGKVITFKALASNDEVVYENKYTYYRLGDFNNDYVIDNKDIDDLSKSYFQKDGKALAHDVDKDNKFDIYDLTMINFQAKNYKTLDTYYKVTFLDLNNDVVAVQYVKMGENASSINLDDIATYKFVGFDKSLKAIYQDTIVKAKYNIE